VWDGLMDRRQPNEQQACLPAPKLAIRDRHPVQAAESDATGEVDADRRIGSLGWRQRFANHAA